MLTSRARESLRGVETVILDEVHAVAGTKRGAHLAVSLERLDACSSKPAQRIGLSATVRPLEEVARFLGGSGPRRGGRPGRPPKEWDLKVVVPVEDMTAPEQFDDVRRRRPGPQRQHLAPRRGAGRRPDRGTPLDHRLRQLPAARRAADRPAQRDRGRPGGAGSRRGCCATCSTAQGQPARQVMAQSGLSTSSADDPRAPAAREGPPRLGLQGAASADRGRPQARPAAGRGRDQQSRARHRHGCGRPRHPDRVAPERGQCPAAGRPRRAPGRRDLPRRAVPQAPRRPRPDRGGRPTDAHRPDRVAPGAGQPARRARPAGGGRHRPRRLVGRRPLRAGPPGRPVHGPAPQRLRSHPRPARRPVPLRRVRRASAAHRLGPGHRHPHRPPRSPATRGHQRRHHPRPRPVRRLPRRRRGPGAPGRGARRGDGLRVPRRRRLRPRRHQLADRGHHPRPGPGHPGAGHPRPAAVLEGRLPRPPRRAGRGDRRVHPRPRRACPRRRRSPAPASTASTSMPPPTWSATSPSRSRPPGCCPATAR